MAEHLNPKWLSEGAVVLVPWDKDNNRFGHNNGWLLACVVTQAHGDCAWVENAKRGFKKLLRYADLFVPLDSPYARTAFISDKDFDHACAVGGDGHS